MPRKAKAKGQTTAAKRMAVARKIASAKAQTGGTGRYIRGKGAYSDSRGPIERAGRELGTKIGSWIGRLTGTGDYVAGDGSQVLAPEPPRMTSQNDAIYITHREYLGDVISSSTANTFKITTFGINPADPTTFPWLSGVCKESFQQFHFEQLMFEFRTFSADALNSTNTALGSVFACINYDYSDPNPASRYEVENTDWARSCKPSQSMLIPVECDPRQTGLNGGLLYILNGNNVPSGADPKTYYLGKLFIGTTGLQGTNVNVGSVYVSYRIKLFKPVVNRPLSIANSFMQQRSGCLVAGNLHFGTAEVANTSNHDTLGVSIAGNVLTINKYRLIVGQRYILSMVYRGGAAAVVPPTIALSANTLALSYFNNFSGAVDSSPQSGLGGSQILYHAVAFSITDNNSDVTCTLTVGTIPAAACTVDLHLYQICGIPPNQIGTFVAP